MTELELHKCLMKDIKVTCTDGIIVTGHCCGYTQALDNEPEIPSIDVRTKEDGLIEIYLNEIQSIEVI